MKKKFLTILSIIALVLGLSATLIACEDGEKIEYSVTVLSPVDEPVSGVTVSWMTGTDVTGSAKTDAEGIAKAELPAGTYSIALSGQPEGLGYTEVSVTATQHDVLLNLTVMKVNYSVTVIDKADARAAGVEVTWSSGNDIAGTATTNASGTASCELDYGTYTVTLANLPEGNLPPEGKKTVSGKFPATTITLRNGVTSNYQVTVKSEGGLLFKQTSLMVYSGNDLAMAGKTNDEGVYNFSAEAGNYVVRLASAPKGYSYELANLTADVLSAEITLKSEVIKDKPAANTRYVIGDIIHDYTFTTPYTMKDGKEWSKSISEILQEKKVLLINNWGTNCSWCVTEMPDMDKLYKAYNDKIEIVAVSNYGGGDSDAAIVNYYKENKYSFPMMRDTNDFSNKFEIPGWPTTIVVDRYGAIARIETGAITSYEAWERMIQKYIGDDYVQTFTPGVPNESINNEVAKPDIEVPADHYDKLATAFHKEDTFNGASVKWYAYPEGQKDQHEYAWPFLYGKAGDLKVSNSGTPSITADTNVIYSSNGTYWTDKMDEENNPLQEEGKANSMSIIYADVTVDPGMVLTFDYFSDTQENADILHIIWDGRIIREISGDSKGWQTCYLYSEITSGKHTLAMTYMKNSTVNTGKDNVYLANLRFVKIDQINEATDMLRGAAYGEIEEGAERFPHYVSVIEPKDTDDGYYRVDLSSLADYNEGKGVWGNDGSPLLLVNLLNVTPWSSGMTVTIDNQTVTPSIAQLVFLQNAETGEYVYSCTFDIGDGVRDYRQDLVRYLTAASASDVADCVPVNKFLHDILVKFMANVSKEHTHDNEWLEACYFYSHYGTGDPVGNPILGLMEETAIEVTEDKTHTVVLSRNMYPFPSTIHTFTPTESAVYKIESLISESTDGTQLASQIWLYDDSTTTGNPLAYSGDTRIDLNGINEQNFVVYYYMTADHKYYLDLAFLNGENGKYDFKITNVGQTVTEFVPCSDDIYDMVLDSNGEFTGKVTLAGAVKYELVKDAEGEFYHAINSDGTIGDYIYLDVTRVTTGALGKVPLNKLVDLKVTDPATGNPLPEDEQYGMFDFRYCVVYWKENEETTKYDTNYAGLPSIDAGRYSNKTDELKEYIKDPKNQHPKDSGLVKVTAEIAEILNTFIELRLNSVWSKSNGGVPSIDKALDNEWLRFCWYEKTHDSKNP